MHALIFSLDHHNYGKWIPIFLHDLKLLKVIDPELYKQFYQGYFVVTKTKLNSVRLQLTRHMSKTIRP